MITNMTLAPIHGTCLPDGFVATYVGCWNWKQRPSTVVRRQCVPVISLDGFLSIDNSTRVSAVKRPPG